MDSIIIVSNKQELINSGYVHENIGKEFIYENKTFTLLTCGIRSMKYPMFPFKQQQAFPIPRDPLWTMNIDDLQLTISAIK